MDRGVDHPRHRRDDDRFDREPAPRRRSHPTLAAGTVGVGMAHWHGVVSATNAGPTQAAAAKLRVTCAGGNPGAGKIKVTVFYLTAAKAA